MNRRQLLLVNVVLSIAAALLIFRLAGEWRSANLRYAALERQTEDAPAYLPPVSGARPVPATRVIVEKNLFSADRNSMLIQAEETAQPASLQVPVVFGTIHLGETYEALMAERSEAATRKFQRVKTGQRLGAYTVVEIQDEKVVIELQGQRTTLDVYQSANSVARQKARSAEPAAPVVETAGSGARPAPSRQRSTAQRPASRATPAQQSSDPGVRVTIEGNRRRLERQTPFGPQVWYENIEQ